MSARHLLFLLAAVLSAGCASRRGPGVQFEARLALAERMADVGDWGGAFRAADGLVAEAPENVPSRLLRARALQRAGAFAEAEADLAKVLAAEPGNATAHRAMGLLLEETRRPTEALRYHEEAARLAPGDARAANNLGFALLVRGRVAEAVAILEAALRSHPGDARLRNNLGFAYAAAGDLARAEGQFSLAGTPAQARHNLGLAHERRKELPQAFDLYLKATRLDPALRSSRARLLHVSRLLGRSVPPDVAAGDLEPGRKP